jgi:hypothetical protein
VLVFSTGYMANLGVLTTLCGPDGGDRLRLAESREHRRARQLRVLGVVVSHTTPVHSHADRRNLELLLERLPAPFLGELAHGAERIAGLDAAALLTLAGSA